VKLIIGDKEIFGISRGIDAQGALLLEQDGVINPGWVGKYHCAALNNKRGARLPFFLFS
jgi:biotin-(acetyl-CoA carboxylase) ligase